MANRIRNKKVSVFLFDEELALLKRKAAEAELDCSEFIRRVLVFHVARPQPIFDVVIGREFLETRNKISYAVNDIYNTIIFDKELRESEIMQHIKNYNHLLGDYCRFESFSEQYKHNELMELRKEYK